MSGLCVGVIGAGAWGTALAQTAAQAGHRVRLWARRRALVEEITRYGENRARLPGIALQGAIEAVAEPAALACCELVLIATPAQHLRPVMAQFAEHLRPGLPAVIAAAPGLRTMRDIRLPSFDNGALSWTRKGGR